MSFFLDVHQLLALSLLLAGLVVVVPAWRIVARAGYAGAWSLLLLVPLANVVALYVFAFTAWPLERRADGLPGRERAP